MLVVWTRVVNQFMNNIIFIIFKKCTLKNFVGLF